MKQIRWWRPRAQNRQGEVCVYSTCLYWLPFMDHCPPPLRTLTLWWRPLDGWCSQCPVFRGEPCNGGMNLMSSLPIRDSREYQRGTMAKGTILGEWLFSKSGCPDLDVEILMGIIHTTSLDYCGVYLRPEMGLPWIWQSLSIKAFTCPGFFRCPSYVFTSFLFYKLYKTFLFYKMRSFFILFFF